MKGEKGLPPPPAEEAAVASFSFDEILNRPVVEERGLTARVSKIISRRGVSHEDTDEVPVTAIQAPENWRTEKLQLEDEIRKLNRQLRQARGDHEWTPSRSNPDAPPRIPEIERLPWRPPAVGSDSVEMDLLRKENYQLRNMTREEQRSKAREIIVRLRAENQALQEENERLRKQLRNVANRAVETNRPPPQFDISSIKPFPLSLSRISEDEITRIVESQFKNDYITSRHGGADPLRNPFDRRRP